MMKERDLHKSHKFRESVKKWGEPLRRHRIFTVASSDQVTDRDVAFPYSSDGEVEHALKQAISDIDREIACKFREHQDLKYWIKNRKAERQCLKTMGFNDSWFQNKPNKTECEVRVHEKAKQSLNDESEVVAIPDHSVRYTRKPRLSEGHVDMLPFLDKPLPIALAIIADYLQDNRLRLVDLFSNVDKNKDWRMSRSELKDSLKHTTIPLKDAHLDELILALDVNDDDELSYRELAKGIETYHKDRRWQKLKEMYDELIFKNAKNNNNNNNLSSEKKAVGFLILPQLDNRDHATDLFLNQRSRERRQRKEEEEKERVIKQKQVKRVQNEWQSTISGDLNEKKSGYMQLMNEECNRCIDLLQSEGIAIKADTIRNVLLPPKDNSTRKCRGYLSCELSVYPNNHPLICKYRNQQQRRLLKSHSSYLPSNSAPIGGSRVEVPLPRVALLDFKHRQERGRKERHERECASPSPCWPQHLLDKLCLCMDDTGSKDHRKTVLFSTVTN